MEDNTRSTVVATHPGNRGFEIRKVRLRVLGVAFVLLATTLVTAGVTAASYARDVRDQDKLNQMVETRPRIDTSIELVRETTDDEHGSFFVEARVDGRAVRIVDPPVFSWTEIFSGSPYEVGDRVTIVVDPGNPHRAWDVRDRRGLSPWSHIMFILFTWGFVSAFVKILMWDRDWTLPFKFRAVPHFLWFPRTATVRVVELRPGKWWDNFTVATSCATPVVELDGDFHVWDVHTYGSADIEEGLEFTVWGRPRPGGWVIGLTTPHTIYPRSRLD